MLYSCGVAFLALDMDYSLSPPRLDQVVNPTHATKQEVEEPMQVKRLLADFAFSLVVVREVSSVLKPNDVYVL